MARVSSIAFLFVVALYTSPVSAITAQDVTGKMTEKERYGYLTGLIDMLSYQALLAGNKDHARCLSDAFYKDNSMAGRLVDALHKFPDKSPEGIVHVMMKKACGG